MNRGDEFACGGHRVYLDADIELSQQSLAEINHELDLDGIELCAPVCKVRRGRSFVTRAYARVWQALPYFRAGVIGCGVYAVSSAGRRRWDKFPPLIADDKFVRLLFDDSERTITKTATFAIRLPEGFVELCKVRTRWSAGNRELAVIHPELARKDRRYYGSAVFWGLIRPCWPACAVFTLVYVVADLRARIRWRSGNRHWERAQSVRESA